MSPRSSRSRLRLAWFAAFLLVLNSAVFAAFTWPRLNSVRRAESVVNALANLGVERSRLVAAGFGQTRRFAYNTSVEGRQVPPDRAQGASVPEPAGHRKPEP